MTERLFRMFPIKDPKNYERLKRLSPLAAVQVWIDGDFSIGEDPALLFAIRTGTNTKLSDSEITDLICDSIEAEEDAKTCLAKIQTSAVF